MNIWNLFHRTCKLEDRYSKRLSERPLGYKSGSEIHGPSTKLPRWGNWCKSLNISDPSFIICNMGLISVSCAEVIVKRNCRMTSRPEGNK